MKGEAKMHTKQNTIKSNTIKINLRDNIKLKLVEITPSENQCWSISRLALYIRNVLHSIGNLCIQ